MVNGKIKSIEERYSRIGRLIRGEYSERNVIVEESIRELCEVIAWISFWLVGIWILLMMSPVVLICLLCRAYMDK